MLLARPAAILVTPSKYVRGSRLLIRQRHIEILRLIEHGVRVTLWGKRQGSYPSCWNFHKPTFSQHRGSGAFNSAVGNTQCDFVSSLVTSHISSIFSCSSKNPKLLVVDGKLFDHLLRSGMPLLSLDSMSFSHKKDCQTVVIEQEIEDELVIMETASAKTTSSIQTSPSPRARTESPIEPDVSFVPLTEDPRLTPCSPRHLQVMSVVH